MTAAPALCLERPVHQNLATFRMLVRTNKKKKSESLSLCTSTAPAKAGVGVDAAIEAEAAAVAAFLEAGMFAVRSGRSFNRISAWKRSAAASCNATDTQHSWARGAFAYALCVRRSSACLSAAEEWSARDTPRATVPKYQGNAGIRRPPVDAAGATRHRFEPPQQIASCATPATTHTPDTIQHEPLTTHC